MSETCANPLLLGWLKDWWDDAREKNTKGVLTFKKAYESMKACPIAFSHPSEAIQLNGLGPKLCERLTASLAAHCEEHGLPMPEPPQNARKRRSDDEVRAKRPKRPKSAKAYAPALRSGPYAILWALSAVPEGATNGLTKNEVIERAQPHCDSSFSAPSDPTKFYTAWNSMKTLESKDLVYNFGRPTRRYALTEEGWEVAKRIRKISAPSNTNALDTPPVEACIAAADQDDFAQGSQAPKRPTAAVNGFFDIDDLDDEPPVTEDTLEWMKPQRGSLSHTQSGSMDPKRLRGDIGPPNAPVAPNLFSMQHADSAPSTAAGTAAATAAASSSQRPTTSGLGSFTPIRIPPGAFSVELILDNREVRAKTDHAYIQNALVSHGVVPSTRSLPLGDALWVARLRPEFRHLLAAEIGVGVGLGAEAEVVLGHVVERKRLDDLLASIRDGRFHEQKFRLRRCGVPHVTYLVEDVTLPPDAALRQADMIASAVASTMVVAGFFVKRTRKLDDTIAYLARMTRLLRRKFDAGTGRGLEVVPSAALGDGRDVEAIRTLLRDETRFLTLDAFAGLAGKNDSLTLRDVFLKMLMCTRGVTGDKALEIQRRWKTPREFVEALEREEGAGGSDGARRRRDMVFKATGQLVGRRKIGKAISAKLCDVWGEA